MKKTLAQTYRHPLSGGLFYQMSLVRAGTFIMGSEEEAAFGDEKPEHLVRLTQDYYMGIFPVTQAVWEAVMGAGSNLSYFRSPDRPVEQVSWQDLVEGHQEVDGQAAFLDLINNNFPAMSAWQFRLPTEAEWEYAAKGGHHRSLESGQENLKAEELYTAYSGSDKLKEVGWYDLNSHAGTKEVGLKAPNELGLYDMSGNILEWCADWDSGSYSDNPYYQQCKEKGIINDPTGPKEGHDRVLRGGSWLFDAQYCRVSYRNSYHPAYRDSFIGFRLVLSPQSRESTSGHGGTE